MLSALQQRAARIIAGLPEAEDFALAGGAALVLARVVERETAVQRPRHLRDLARRRPRRFEQWAIAHADRFRAAVTTVWAPTRWA